MNLLLPKEKSNASSRNTCREQPLQTCLPGEYDCAQIPGDRHPGRPDPTETPKDCPLDQRDMRKLLDLQTVTYNTLLTTPHFKHHLHTLPHLPLFCLQARNSQRGKASLLQPPARALDAQPAPASILSSLTTAIPSQFSIKTGWCLGLLVKSSRRDCSLPGAVTWRSAELSHNQHSGIQQVQGLG